MSPRGRRDGGSRSEDDRQRARLEREQRRARREGRPVPRSLEELEGAGGLTGEAPALGDVAPPASPGVDPSESDAPRAAPPRGMATRPADPAPEPPRRAGPHPGHPSTPATPAGRPAASAASAATPDAQDGSPATWATDPPPAAAEPALPATDPQPAAVEPASSAAAPGTPAAPADAQPWWATAAAEAPAPPRAEPAPAPPPPAARSAAPASPPPPAARSAAPPASPAPPAERQPARPDAPQSQPRPARDEHALTASMASVAVPPRGAGPAAPRPVESWFDDETGDRTGGQGTDHDHTYDPGDGRTGDVPLTAAGGAGGGGPLAPLKPAGPGAGGVPPATVQARKPRSRRGVSRIVPILVLVPIVLLLAAAYVLFEPGKGDGEGRVQVRIPEGSSVSDIGSLLQEKGVIANPIAFAIRARLSGAGANLKAGTLNLRHDMSYAAALDALQQDPVPPSVVRVGVPEGLSRREAAASVKEAGVQGSYLRASASTPGFDPRDYGQPKGRKGLEGFLFPATYELPKSGATAKALVAQQVAAFRRNIRGIDMTRARRAKLSRYDVLIIASMVEREVREPAERKLVAAVIWNRLKDGTALGIDATTRYAVRNWTKPLTQSEIDRKTPYDTRYKTGLPPTPIGSPGLAAIRAAANPAKVSYRWYVVRPCGGGRHSFASTSAKFDRDRQAYVAAQRRANGDPSDPDAPGCKG